MEVRKNANCSLIFLKMCLQGPKHIGLPIGLVTEDTTATILSSTYLAFHHSVNGKNLSQPLQRGVPDQISAPKLEPIHRTFDQTLIKPTKGPFVCNIMHKICQVVLR